MIEEFLQPVSYEPGDIAQYKLGAVVQFNQGTLPDWEKADIAIIGLQDGRGSDVNEGSGEAPDVIRKHLYELSAHNQKCHIIDLGNIKPGKSFADTEVALVEITKALLAENVIPVIIGGNMEFSYALYKGFERIARNVEVSVVTPYLDLVRDGYLKNMILHEPNYLFNINLLAYQGHFTNPESVNTFLKLYFNAIRLGIVRQHLKESEPVMRNTDLFAIDVSAIKFADAPGNEVCNPNGLSADEACQLCWYAGVSDQLREFGVFEINPEFDDRHQTALLGAQMVWYFIDGFYSRKGDHPSLHNEFIKYRCTMNGNNPDVIFLKSKRTDRWWMEVPDPKSMGNTGKNLLIPCSYNDYQNATNGEMPERFWQALQKIGKP